MVIKAHGKGGSIAYTFEGSSIIAEIKEGSRNSTLTSLAGSMRARGMTEESIYAALLAETKPDAILRLMKRKLKR